MTLAVAPTTRHTEATRKAILDAAAALFMERQSDGFAVQEVADRAGLTHRTVYRYFPTRQELLRSTAPHLAPGVAEEPFSAASTVDEWIDALAAHFAFVETHFEIARSVLAAAFASSDWRVFGQDIRERDRHRWAVFRRGFSHLRERDARATFATLRQLTSSASYISYRLRFGMSPSDATEAIHSAASQIVKEARRRERAAARLGTRSKKRGSK